MTKRIDGQDESHYYRSERRAGNNEIGKLPAVKDAARRTRACESFTSFCHEYLPKTFFRPFQRVHDHIATDGERAVKSGGKKIILAPRRTGKTALLRALILWAICCHPRRHKYVLYIGSVADATKRTFDWIFDQFITNNLLADDFSEVCYPLRSYRGNPQKRITHNGEPVNAKWNGDRIVLPTIQNSPYSGITIRFMSVSSGAILGTDITIGGVAYRPSLVAIDDVMSHETARSPRHVTKIMEVIRQGLSDLAGFDPITGKPLEITILAVMTARQEADVAMQLIDDPDYEGIRYRRLDPMPQRMDLWCKYRIRRIQSLKSATAFYRENREEMDFGCVAIDPTDFADKFESAVQSAMDIWAIDPQRFYTEQQNDPTSAYQVEALALTPEMVVSRATEYPPMQVPDWTEFLTGFVDVGDHYLNWEIVAFGDHYRKVHTVAFGWFPDQGTADVTKHHCVFDIQEDYANAGRTPGDRVSAAIGDLLESLVALPFVREDGSPYDIFEASDYRHLRSSQAFARLAVIGVDCGSGTQLLPVWAAVARFAESYGPLAIPCNGSTAQHRLIRNMPLHYGDDEWSAGTQTSHRDWIENASHTFEHRSSYPSVTRSVWWDVNIWKTRRNSAWMASPLSDGCHTIAKYSEDWLRRYAEHQCAEESFFVSLASMREYCRWREKKPRVSDNEFLDTNAGCWMLADYVGMRDTVDVSATPTPMSRDEMQRILHDRVSRSYRLLRNE